MKSISRVWDVPLKHNKKKKVTTPPKLSDVFEEIVTKNEKIKPYNISVMGIAREKNVQHRRLYDFFSLLTALGVCRFVHKGQIAWVGMKEIEGSLENWYASLEIRAVTQNMKEIFDLGTSPSLGNLAMHFIGLFLYLDKTSLSVKQAAIIFQDGRNDTKSLERRLYLVISCLEVIGLVERSSKVGQYKIIVNRESIVGYGWKERQRYCMENSIMAVEGLLSRLDKTFMDSVYYNRELQYNQILQNSESL